MSLREALESGRFNQDTLIRQKGVEEWGPISSVKPDYLRFQRGSSQHMSDTDFGPSFLNVLRGSFYVLGILFMLFIMFGLLFPGGL